MLNRLLNRPVYVRVSKNQFQVRNVVHKREVVVFALEPFTTKRLLVGDFATAEKYLREGVKKVCEGQGWFWLAVSPVIIIQPLEMIEGGLSEVEKRVLMELAAGAGGRKAVIWIGHQLSDQEVVEHAKNV